MPSVLCRYGFIIKKSEREPDMRSSIQSISKYFLETFDITGFVT